MAAGGWCRPSWGSAQNAACLPRPPQKRNGFAFGRGPESRTLLDVVQSHARPAGADRNELVLRARTRTRDLSLTRRLHCLCATGAKLGRTPGVEPEPSPSQGDVHSRYTMNSIGGAPPNWTGLCGFADRRLCRLARAPNWQEWRVSIPRGPVLETGRQAAAHSQIWLSGTDSNRHETGNNRSYCHYMTREKLVRDTEFESVPSVWKTDTLPLRQSREWCRPPESNGHLRFFKPPHEPSLPDRQIERSRSPVIPWLGGLRGTVSCFGFRLISRAMPG